MSKEVFCNTDEGFTCDAFTISEKTNTIIEQDKKKAIVFILA